MKQAVYNEGCIERLPNRLRHNPETLPPSMPDYSRQRLHFQFYRFLAVGAANTALAWGVYWLSLQLMHRQWAFAVTYLASLAFSVVAHSRLSFDLKLRTIGFAAYAAYCTGMYVFGAIMLEVIVRAFDVEQAPAIAVLTLLQLPVNFFASRWLMNKFARNKETQVT